MGLLTSKKTESKNGGDPKKRPEREPRPNPKPKTNGAASLYSRLSMHQAAQNRWIPMTIIVLLMVNILAQCSTKSEIAKVQRQEKYAFLQREDGSTERIEQTNSIERTPAVLKKFAYDWTKTCFTWTGKTDGKNDVGVDVLNRKYPTNFYNCGVAIAPEFRQLYQTGLYDLYENHPVFRDALSLKSFTGSTAATDRHEVQIYVQPLEPEKVGVGRWEIPVVATREFRKAGTPFAVEKFNQTLELAAVPPYTAPWSKDQTDFGKLLDDWQLQGLRIVKITRLRDRLAQ